MAELSGLAAIVTGGGSGIGLATARLLASRGAEVAVLDLKPADIAVSDGGLLRPASPRSPAPSIGKSNLTRSMSVGPSKSSSAKRPIARGVGCGSGRSMRWTPRR